MALSSKAKFCGRSIVGVAGSNPAERMDVRLLCVLNVAASRRADHSFRKFLHFVCVCVCVCVFVCHFVCDLEA